MKLGNRFSAIALGIALLSGCATQQSPLLSTSKNSVPKLIETTDYMPKISYDENGKKLPYEASQNPYLLEEGKVSRGSVLLFIEAQKAMKADDFETAETKLKVITDQDPTLGGPWALLGEIALKRNQFDVAQKRLTKAIEITPSHMAAYSMLAMALRNQGKFHHAQNTLALALKQWPDFPEAHLNLGILYDIYLNQPEKAQRHIEAYQFLTSYSDPKAQEWLNEIQQRTGLAFTYKQNQPTTQASNGQQEVNTL